MGLLFLAGCAKAEVVAKKPPAPEPVAAEAEVEIEEETQELPPIECPKGAERQEQQEGDLVFCAEIRGDKMVLQGPIRWSRSIAGNAGILSSSGEFARGYPAGLWQRWHLRSRDLVARGWFDPVGDGPVVELYADVDIGVMHMRLWNLQDQFWREPGLSVGGRRRGTWTAWYATRRGETNKACEGRFTDDERDGEWECWYPSGEVWWAGEYRAGEKDGSWIVRHPTGGLWVHVQMQADVPHGEYMRRHDDGGPAAKGQYSHGKKVGKWAYWDEEGRALQNDPWRLELPQLYPDGSELQLLAHVEHGAGGQRFAALRHLITMTGRREHELTRDLWLREERRDRAWEQFDAASDPPTLGPMLLLALYDMKPPKYLSELRKLHALRLGDFERSVRFKGTGAWRGEHGQGGEFLWVGETGYRLMLRGELPKGDALEETLRILSVLADSPRLANRRRAAEVFAKFEGAPAFDPEVFPGIPFENTARTVLEWLRANLGTCKWDKKAKVYRCNPAAP